MDINAMTPEDLRELAARKEAQSIYQSHMDEADRDNIININNVKKPWEKPVEVDNHVYLVDMRRMKSRKFMHLVTDMEGSSAAQKTQKQLAVLDYVFEPIENEIASAVEAKVGYDDFEEYYSICAKIFESLNLKN